MEEERTVLEKTLLKLLMQFEPEKRIAILERYAKKYGVKL